MMKITGPGGRQKAQSTRQKIPGAGVVESIC